MSWNNNNSGTGYQQMEPNTNFTNPAADSSQVEGEKEEPKWKRQCRIATTVVGAIVGIVMLVMSSIAYGSLNDLVNDYNSVVNSWEATPITGISFVPNSGSGSHSPCSEPIQSSWPGLYSACNCDGPGNHGNSTSSDTMACTSQQITDNCVTRSSHFFGVTLDVFDNATLCVTRGGVDALSRSQNAADCSSSERVCGSGVNSFCWPTSQSACPITDIVFDSTLYTQAQSGADDVPTVAGTSGGVVYYLYVKRGGQLNGLWPQRYSGGFFNVTGLPIVDIDFAPADACTLGGCGYSGRSAEFTADIKAYKANHPTSGYYQKPLPCNGGCTPPEASGSISPAGIDFRYVRTVFSVPESQLYGRYSPASIPVEFINPSPTAFPWRVEYRSEIEWNVNALGGAKTCPQSRSDVVSKQSDVTGVRTAQFILLFFGILSFIFLSLYFPCIELFGKPELKKKLANWNLCCKVTIKGTTLICTIVTVVVAAGLMHFWNSVNEGANCSDPLTDETFQGLGKKFSDLSYKNVLSSVSAGFTSIADVAGHFLARC